MTAPVDPQVVLDHVQDFVGLARSGAYMAGDRRVSPKERSRWRFTFRRLLADARQALRADDVAPGVAAMKAMIDLACEIRDYDYFHSDDPVEAAGIVVSDEAAILWARTIEAFGFAAFASDASAQLVQWESRYGWTRGGYGRVSDRETALADVVAKLLPATDAWASFAGGYLTALDGVVHTDAAAPKSTSYGNEAEWRRGRRAEALAAWHERLLDRLIDTEGEPLLDRVAGHPALAGPELTFFQAQLAHRRGDAEAARHLMHECLTRLPGHQGFLDFAVEIDAPLPPHAQRTLEERRTFYGDHLGSR